MSNSLSESSFWILSSLAGDRRHGYGILQDVARLSDGATTLKVPTLYAALDRLVHDDLIVADGEEVVDGRARRYYTLSDAGRALLAEEAERLAARARVAQERLRVQARPALTRTALA